MSTESFGSPAVTIPEPRVRRALFVVAGVLTLVIASAVTMIAFANPPDEMTQDTYAGFGLIGVVWLAGLLLLAQAYRLIAGKRRWTISPTHAVQYSFGRPNVVLPLASIRAISVFERRVFGMTMFWEVLLASGDVVRTSSDADATRVQSLWETARQRGAIA